MHAAAARAGASIVLAGWAGRYYGDYSEYGVSEVLAVTLDEDGAELWSWQVRHALAT